MAGGLLSPEGAEPTDVETAVGPLLRLAEQGASVDGWVDLRDLAAAVGKKSDADTLLKEVSWSENRPTLKPPPEGEIW